MPHTIVYVVPITILHAYLLLHYLYMSHSIWRLPTTILHAHLLIHELYMSRVISHVYSCIVCIPITMSCCICITILYACLTLSLSRMHTYPLSIFSVCVWCDRDRLSNNTQTDYQITHRQIIK